MRKMYHPTVEASEDYHGSYNLKAPIVDEERDEANEKLFWAMVSSIDSRDAYLHHLYQKSLNSPSRKHKLELVEQLAQMMYVDEVFADFLDTSISKVHNCLNEDEEGCTDIFIPKDFDCLRSMVSTYETYCGQFDDYARKFIKYLVRECEQPTTTLPESIDKLQKACD
jgi:hypothetical protein